MKKMVFIFLILIIPCVLALETTLKLEYSPLETLIAEIPGNFINPIKASDIQFYSGRLYVPMIYDIAKIQDTYYLYAVLPDKQRDYTLVIKNAHYFETGKEIKQDLRFNFTVKGNISLFNVNPGFIITNKDFNIKVQSNLKEINLKTEFLESTQEFSIKTAQKKTIPFSLPETQEVSFTFLKLTADSLEYKIPVAIFSASEKIESIPLRFESVELNLPVLVNKESIFELVLFNTGQENITDIILTCSGLENILKIKPEKIENLKAGSFEKLLLTVNSSEQGIKNCTLKASSSQYNSEIYLIIDSKTSQEQLEESIKEHPETREIKISCSDLKGMICTKDKECSVETTTTIDGLCCTGQCKEAKKDSTGKIIAIIAIVIVIIIIAFFVIKKLKLKNKTSKDLYEEKSKSYEKRFKPSSEEVRGKLTRI